MNPDRIIRRTAKLVEAQVDGELIALDTRKGSCYGFNASATRIWSLAEHPISFSDLCATLTREFAVAPEQCMQEVAEVIGDLERDGLVEVVPQNLP